MTASSRNLIGSYSLGVTQYDTYYSGNEVFTNLLIDVADICDTAIVSLVSEIEPIIFNAGSEELEIDLNVF
jgi:hypothetical protein